VAVGQEVRATVEAFPGKVFTGRITFVHPHVDHMSRTVNARAVLTNSDLTLRPGMYASAAILTSPVMDAVQVPRESVIDTGTRQIVFVAEAEGHFTPRMVHMGLLGDSGRVQILDGLSPGETVVTSGEFLLDVESRTTEAINKLRSSMPDATATLANASDNTMPAMPMATTVPTSEPSIPAPQPDGMPLPATSIANQAKATSKNLTVAYCPMKKAHWLQHGLKIANPYFGSQMLDCGEVQQTLTAQEGASPIAATINAYLRLEEGLVADRLDKQAQTTLKAAAQLLTQPEFTQLRSASLAVASAPDIARARVTLETLSETLLKAVRDLPATRPAPASMPSSVGGRP